MNRSAKFRCAQCVRLHHARRGVHAKMAWRDGFSCCSSLLPGIRVLCRSRIALVRASGEELRQIPIAPIPQRYRPVLTRSHNLRNFPSMITSIDRCAYTVYTSDSWYCDVHAFPGWRVSACNCAHCACKRPSWEQQLAAVHVS